MADESELEKKVDDSESTSFLRKAWNLTYNTGFATAATALGLATAGAAAPIVGGALGAGFLIGGLAKKGKSLYDTVNDSIKAYAGVSVVLQPMIWLGNVTYPLFSFANPVVNFLAKSAYALTGYNAAFVSSFKGTHHFMDGNISPKGFGKTVKDNFYNEWKRIGKIFSPGYLTAAHGLTELPGTIAGQTIPLFAVNALPVGVINSYKPPTGPEETEQKQPEATPAPQKALQPA